MKKIILLIVFSLTTMFAQSYTEEGIRYEKVQYPFEVSYLKLTSNNKQYEMVAHSDTNLRYRLLLILIT